MLIILSYAGLCGSLSEGLTLASVGFERLGQGVRSFSTQRRRGAKTQRRTKLQGCVQTRAVGLRIFKLGARCNSCGLPTGKSAIQQAESLRYKFLMSDHFCPKAHRWEALRT